MMASIVRNAMIVSTVMMGLALHAEGVEPVVPSARDEAKSVDTSPAWNRAEIVFVGELTKAETGAATMSIPPIFLNRLSFKVEKVLRGNLTDKTLSCRHSYRDDTNFPYDTGKKYIVALTTPQQTAAVRNLRLADAEAVKEVELSCALPVGWTISCGETHSPWAGMGKSAWSVELPADMDRPKLVCNTTGRPGLLAGTAVEWTAEPVPPKKSIQWTNPDGDGEHKLTLTNPTDKPLPVPALLTQDGKILWRECVVIVSQERAYPCPGAKGVTGKVATLVLKPKESVSAVANVLAIKGIEWPGGSRVEFTFCLGDKAKTTSFYYMSRHHDALRDAAIEKITAEANTKVNRLTTWKQAMAVALARAETRDYDYIIDRLLAPTYVDALVAKYGKEEWKAKFTEAKLKSLGYYYGWLEDPKVTTSSDTTVLRGQHGCFATFIKIDGTYYLGDFGQHMSSM